jgi:hypothetical protein
VAGALGRVSPALATHTGYIDAGATNDTTTTTTIRMTGNDLYAFVAEGTGGTRGVYGISGSDYGVRGDSVSSWGVLGLSDGSVGVMGWAWVPGQNTGVMGYSGPLGTGLPPAAPAQTGVYGYAAQSTTANGVFGQTTVGRGVRAASNSGQGLLASATTGTAVYAYADTNGTALRTTKGHVRFSTAGLATILAGHSNVLVTPGFDISLASSKVLAVLQGNPGGSTVLRYVLRDDPNNRFTIQLSANATVNTPVAWFVIS